MKTTTLLGLAAVLIVIGCDRPVRDLPLDDGPGAEAVELRRQIQERAAAACSQLGPSLPMLSVAKTRVDLTSEALQCLDLTTPAERLGPSINPRSREESEAPIAEWVSRMGAAGLPLLRQALERPDGSDGERHLAFWALARMVAEGRPHPAGLREARCLLDQWQHEAGHRFGAQTVADSFEPWPEDQPIEPAADGVLHLRSDPRLPAPFDQPRSATDDGPDTERSRPFSEALGTLRHRRKISIDEASALLRDLQQAQAVSWQTPPDDLKAALAVFAVLRPVPRALRDHVLPLADRPEVADWPYNEDPFMAVLTSYGVEALPILRSRLQSEHPKVREKHFRLLQEAVGGTIGTDCLVSSWAEHSSKQGAEKLLAFKTGEPK